MKLHISTQNLVLSLSEAIDLIAPSVSYHHRFVACAACQICEAAGIPLPMKKEIIYASALHDIGSLSESEKLRLANFNYEEEDGGHAKRGYLLVKEYKPFEKVAQFIRYHHSKWGESEFDLQKNEIRIGANIILLADRIAVLINLNKNILEQAPQIADRILKMPQNTFAPQLLDAFLKLSKVEAFWLNIITKSLPEIFLHNGIAESDFDRIDNYELIKIFSRIIDFRSHFTAAHSSGVAASAKALCQMAGFSEDEAEKMELAGFVHDIGKLAVPTEILEKTGPLTHDERNIILTHTYYTDMILSRIKNFDTIRQWAAYHHEKMDGSGYPFHLESKNLPIGSRIMAVADIFVALFEDRPYRKGMTKEQAFSIIENMAPKALDPLIVKLLKDNFEYINSCRIKAQEKAAIEYSEFFSA